MPRLPRLHVPGGFYHVVLRGNRRQALFDSHQDREELNKLVAESLERKDAPPRSVLYRATHTATDFRASRRSLHHDWSARVTKEQVVRALFRMCAGFFDNRVAASCYVG